VDSERRTTNDEQRELQEAVAYFRSQPGLARFLDGLVAKYRSLGRLGGVVELKTVSAAERTALESLLRKRLPEPDLRLAAADFPIALAATRFESLEPVTLLTAWQGEGKLLTRRERREQAEQARQASLRRLQADFPHPLCQAWLQAALDKNSLTRLTQRAEAGDPDFSVNMTAALSAIANLPEDYERLPLFARRVCGDPHGLDSDRAAGRLFLEGLRLIRAETGNPVAATSVSAVETLNELLYGVKLLRDDLLNFATCYGLAAADAAGRELAYWRLAATEGAPLNVPLRELVRVTDLRPASESLHFSGTGGEYEVFIVENSGVFSALLDNRSGVGDGSPLVCLHGQFKLASWVLLDRLVACNARLRYSGDFDPEGLQMAQKLLLRYPGRAAVWRMSIADYRQAVPSVALEPARLQKLQSICVPELQVLAAEIALQGLAAYQEGILANLAVDFLNLSSGANLMQDGFVKSPPL
jgi:uncharacterized protein (TIGR02679 family)